MLLNEVGGLRPCGFERGEPVYKLDAVLAEAIRSVNSGTYFNSYKVKKMTSDTKKASDLLDEADKIFRGKLDKFQQTQDRLIDSSTAASRSVRESTQKMSEGLARIEKQADFNRLERCVVLLERANQALASLAELEQDGKLDRITNALK